MQTQMTERDKRLIVILSIIVLVVGFGWWGIRPALKNNKKMQAEVEKQQELMIINDAKLSKLFMYESEAESYEELIAEEREHYFPMMSSSEIDRYFTNMILDRGLSAYDLSIRVGSKPAPVEPYKYSAMAELIAQEAAEASQKSSSSKKNDEEEDPFDYESSHSYNSEIYAVDLSMRLAGDMEDLKGFIEDLSKSDKLLLVRNCVWSEQVSMVNDYSNYDSETGEGGEFEPLMITTTVINMNVTMYMCDQSEAAEDTEEAAEE